MIELNNVQKLIDTQNAMDIEFIDDFSQLQQFERCIENNLTYLKHELIPNAVKFNRSEVTLNLELKKFLPSWIMDNSRYRELAFKTIINTLVGRSHKYGYTIERLPDNDKLSIKVTW